MLTPNPPTPSRIDRISPTLYETLLGCPAEASWIVFGRHDLVAAHPLAILGTCFHEVLEAVQKGQISGSADECREAARDRFDQRATHLHGSASRTAEGEVPLTRKAALL